MRFYLSGSISKNENASEDFRNAEWKIREIYPGAEVINPAAIGVFLPSDFSHDEYMRVSYELLDMSDAIVMIDGWRKSVGACMEYGYAKAKGKRVIYL